MLGTGAGEEMRGSLGCHLARSVTMSCHPMMHLLTSTLPTSVYPRVAANASLSHEVSQIFARGQISRYPDTCHTWRRFREEERDARRQIRRSMACSNFRPNSTTQENKSTEHLFSNNSDARHKPVQLNDRKQPYHVFLIPVLKTAFEEGYILHSIPTKYGFCLGIV